MIAGSIPLFNTLSARIMFFDILKENAVKFKGHYNVIFKKVIKSVWRMPWLSEAMKDVTSCDKLRGGANNLRSGDFRMGKPFMLKT